MEKNQLAPYFPGVTPGTYWVVTYPDGRKEFWENGKLVGVVYPPKGTTTW